LAIIISIVETPKSCGEAMEGESTLFGGQLGQFHDMCIKYKLTKCFAFNFGFHFLCLGFIF
jgi:hypothetical protein